MFSLRFRCFLFSFLISNLNFQQKAQNVLILTRDTLRLPIGVKEWLVDDGGVGELYTLCMTGHNNGPLLGASYPKSGERFIGKKVFESPPTDQIDYLCRAPQCVLLVFVRFLVRASSLCINFLT